MANKKPDPLIVESPHPRCPVCGEKSYSPAGIHPQCAVRQADAVRLERVPRPPRKAARPAASLSPWQKACPKCKAAQHLRKKTCDCGHAFTFPSHSPLSAGKPA